VRDGCHCAGPAPFSAAPVYQWPLFLLSVSFLCHFRRPSAAHSSSSAAHWSKAALFRETNDQFIDIMLIIEDYLHKGVLAVF